MSISRIQSGDNVKIISGKYKNTIGIVTKVVKLLNGKIRVAVAGVEKIAKFQKANRQYGMPGSISQVDRMIDVSNVSLLDDKGNISKVKIELKDSKKTRVYKTTGKPVVKVKSEDSVDKKITKKPIKKTK
jgi:large subunit ribosomal protein L24